MTVFSQHAISGGASSRRGWIVACVVFLLIAAVFGGVVLHHFFAHGHDEPVHSLAGFVPLNAFGGVSALTFVLIGSLFLPAAFSATAAVIGHPGSPIFGSLNGFARSRLRRCAEGLRDPTRQRMRHIDAPLC